jgi:hypothetical protein
MTLYAYLIAKDRVRRLDEQIDTLTVVIDRYRNAKGHKISGPLCEISADLINARDELRGQLARIDLNQDLQEKT